MYGNINPSLDKHSHTRNTTWDNIKIQVHRCSECEAIHEKRDNLFNIGCSIIFIFCACYSSYATLKGRWLANTLTDTALVILFNIIISAIIAGIITALSSIFIEGLLKNPKSKDNFYDHPIISKLRKEKWEFGTGPKKNNY